MRTFLTAAILALAISAVAACGDDDDVEEEKEQSGEAEEEAEDVRRQGGEVTIAVAAFQTLDPHATTTALDYTIAQMLWRGLYSLTAENLLTAEQNGIADGMPEVSEDGRTVTVRLREGLTWSDGDDLRAEDYVAGVVRSCSPLIISETQYLLSNLKGCDDLYFADPATADLDTLQAAVGVRAVDAFTIEFSLNQPQPSFPAALTLPLAFPVPVHLPRFATATAGTPGEWGSDPAQLVYNGPYVLTEYAPGERAAIEPNPNWSGSVRPTLDRILLRSFSDEAAAVDAYRAGEIQLTRLQGELLSGARAEFGDEYFQEMTARTRALNMLMTHETLASLDVRLALARAIDREGLNEVVFDSGSVPTTTWTPEATSGLPPTTYESVIGFDPEAARRHLADAGYEDGEGFPTLKLLSLSGEVTPEFPATAEFLRSNFKEVLNIDIEVELVDQDTFLQRLGARDFELYVFGWVQDYPDPENWILGIFDTDGVENYPGCSDPEIDALIEEARFNPNDEERREQYRETERLAIEKVCGLTPYIHVGLNFLIKPELVGFKENASGDDIQLPGESVSEAWGYRASR